MLNRYSGNKVNRFLMPSAYRKVDRMTQLTLDLTRVFFSEIKRLDESDFEGIELLRNSSRNITETFRICLLDIFFKGEPRTVNGSLIPVALEVEKTLIAFLNSQYAFEEIKGKENIFMTACCNCAISSAQRGGIY